MDAVADALGSLRASGLVPGDDVRRIAVAWADGRLSSARLQSVERALVAGEALGPFVALAEGHEAQRSTDAARPAPEVPPGRGPRSPEAPGPGADIAATAGPGGARPNIAGLRDPAALVRLEADLVHLRLVQLATREVAGSYDLRHLRRIHLRLLGALYWSAGDLRTAPVDRRGRPSCTPGELRQRGDAALAGLERGAALSGLPTERVLEQVTATLAALDALHPFVVGNGCAVRAFVGAWAAATGHRIAWRRARPVPSGTWSSRCSARSARVPRRPRTPSDARNERSVRLPVYGVQHAPQR